jgi:Tti2 family
MIHNNWHLCIPPLLTLLDDPSTIVRVRGLHILCEVLGRIPPRVLQQAGLGEVFEDAVMPTLLFLPPLTPVEESLSLLTSAYSALLSLGDARYPTENERSNKLKFLDRIMRQGVLQGSTHSGENVMIAELLVEEVITLFNSMGIHSVKYLKVGHEIVSYRN